MAPAVRRAISVPLVVVALSSCGGEPEPGGLRIERTPEVPEIVVYVEDLDANQPETADGAAQITLECIDDNERVIWTSREAWPFEETDEGTLDPHVHLRIEPARIERIERCRLRDTDPPLEGRLI
jgi:hypothetical protein